MSTPAIDRDTIQALVAEVLRRIHAQSATTPPVAPAATTAPAAAPASSSGAPQTTTAAVAVADRVITVALVDSLAAGTRRLTVEARAVITPSARDRARELGIDLVRGAATAGSTARAALPFFIAHAQCRGDAAPRAAAIARAVPSAQQLPTTGLVELIDALAAHASRDGGRGILLTSRPYVALILANRSASLRAVTARDLAAMNTAISDCEANLIVVDPAGFSAGALERLCVDFASRQGLTPPPELSKTAAGCGCKSHPH
jgi:pyruvate/2-oxoglutarate dehydrogenase complex dihydrolipoamide acyltransferase (E2) component